MKKNYYRLILTPESPLHISNGEGEISDSDLIRDERGIPFIPGTGLAGALRALLSDEQAKICFGDMDEYGESAVLVSDAVLMESNKKDFKRSMRDGVGIETGIYRTAEDTAKYNFEVVESSNPFYAVIEYTSENKTEDNSQERAKNADTILESLICRILKDGLMLGAKTSRGYGRFSVHAEKKEFDFDHPEPTEKPVTEWLEFDPYHPEAHFDPFTPKAESTVSFTDKIIIEFKVKGSFTVRVYNTEPSAKGESVPHSISLRQQVGQKLPVIPGTAWAGSFRHKMLELVDEAFSGEQANNLKNQVNELFGVVRPYRKSILIFSESSVEGSKERTVTRNRIDRFTAIPTQTALFSSVVMYGGNGKLEITIRKPLNDSMLSLLRAAVQELKNGMMTVGGEAGAGRGLLEVTGLTESLNRQEGE